MLWPHSTHAHSTASTTPTDHHSHCSRLCIPVHSPWLTGYIDVTQNVLVILTMPEIFLDILYISSTLLLPQMMFLGDLGDAGNLGLPGCRLLPLEAGLQKMNGGII